MVGLLDYLLAVRAAAVVAGRAIAVEVAPSGPSPSVGCSAAIVSTAAFQSASASALVEQWLGSIEDRC